ncbi:hypothetical protein HKX48_002113 [Thoreauomyces humboldtii]|nr:hypothetical protein HKX48_002113 [Thoreauomyces humboldtii]
MPAGAQAAIAASVEALIVADPSVVVPNALTGISPLQSAIIILELLPSYYTTSYEVVWSVPFTTIGIVQILCGAFPTLFANRAQWRKPIFLLSSIACVLFLIAQFTAMDIAATFYVHWQKSVVIDLSQLIGFKMVEAVTPREDVYCIFVAAGQSVYEVVAAYRAGVFLGHRKPKTIALYALTALVVLLHTSVSFAIVFYGVARGNAAEQAVQDSFARAGLFDLGFGASIEILTNCAFIYHLIEKMGFDQYIFQKLLTSRGVLRLLGNIVLAIATLTQLARPSYLSHPLFGGCLCFWVGWQINTFVQFSFVETKEIVQDYSKRSQGGTSKTGSESKQGTSSITAPEKNLVRGRASIPQPVMASSETKRDEAV